MPTTDWQFWVVSVVAMLAAAKLGSIALRMVRSMRGRSRSHPARLTISAPQRGPRTGEDATS